MTCHGLRPLARWRDYSVSGSQAGRSAITRSGSLTLRCLRLSSSRSSSTQACFCSCSFAANIYGWYAWSRQNSQQEAELQIRWLPLPKAIARFVACVVAIGLMTVYINPVFAFLTRIAVAAMSGIGLQVTMPVLQPDAFPFWDSCMMVLSIAAMILMTRKYVENWLLWVIINVISVVIFACRASMRCLWNICC